MDLRKVKALSVCTHFDFDAEPEEKSQQTCMAPAYVSKILSQVRTEKAFAYSSACYDAERIEKENERMFDFVHKSDDVYMWAVIDPRRPGSVSQCSSMAGDDKVVGIVVLPAAHGYAIEDYEDVIFSAAESVGGFLCACVEKDAGGMSCLADRHPGVNIIMNALRDETYIEQIKSASRGNLYADTSGAAMINDFLIELASREGVADKILYGDGGLGFVRSRVEYALIPEPEKLSILRGNAERLFAGRAALDL